MTTVAYLAVAREGRTFEDQIVLDGNHDAPLRALTDAVHAQGAAACAQLSHCGFFTKLSNRTRGGALPRSASASINRLGLAAGVPRCRAMTLADIESVTNQFVRAALRAQELGFDAIELHMGHGYLLSQFLSPAYNRRGDGYGGSLWRRARLPTEVLAAVRAAVSPRLAVTAKLNLSDGFPGGMDISQSIGTARLLQAQGVDGLVLSGGFTSRSPFFLLRGDRPLASMVRNEANRLQRQVLRVLGPALVQKLPFEELFFLPEARLMRAAVRLPLGLVGGVVSRTGVAQTLDEGFDFCVLGRALIADPDFVTRLQRGELERSRCTHCNECVAMIEAGGISCVLDSASGGSR